MNKEEVIKMIGKENIPTYLKILSKAFFRCLVSILVNWGSKTFEIANKAAKLPIRTIAEE